ncbi:hypothetical protein QEJ31_14100 [Pigmentibacter sp. JX0631]|uniref:hypothetical protein n=1 Tax=Pigmentibacter sp. JX0631 TaxID=2976982 RepID=UPI00246849C3|nr:hypothetical protein [Pigmentibacter sp. JX0631]WGL59660.1 hypothetical protein QEJ31_14100 [Pigmentibacter sp. JX0631]
MGRNNVLKTKKKVCLLKAVSFVFLFFPIYSYASSKEFYLFFSINHLLNEKDNKLEIIPSRIKLGSSYDSMILAGQDKVCDEILSFSNDYISIKDPGLKLTTYTECKVSLINKKNKISDEVTFKLNRTFTSWCLLKERTSDDIKLTIDAVLNTVQVKECNDFALKQTLFNAKMLNLTGKKIVDLSPLSGLINLRALWLDDNKISKIDPISSLRNLIVLSLSNNSIENINNISNLKELQWLFLSANKIRGVEELATLKKIKVLSIKNNFILNPAPLYSFQANTIILPQGNPFIKDTCLKYSTIDDKNSVKQLNWLDKVCKFEQLNKNVRYLNSSSSSK